MARTSRSGSALRLVDVAERAGVSLATASRALSGRDGVSPVMAAHVRKVADDMGYVANPHARTLAGGATSVAGLIVYEIGDPYFAEIANGVVRVAGEHGWMVQISHARRGQGEELTQIRTLRAHRVGAILIAGSGYVDRADEADADAELLDYQRQGGRVAVIGRHHLRCDAVIPANRAGGRTIAEHLLSLGHRRIGVVAGPAVLTTIADRIEGLRTALADGGVVLADDAVVYREFTRAGGLAGATHLLDAHPDLTAIVALNDAMALGVLAALRGRGLAVPDDVSVVGFDDIQVAADVAPALTTIRLPMDDMGATAIGMALKPPAARPRRRITGHELVVRASTGPARRP